LKSHRTAELMKCSADSLEMASRLRPMDTSQDSLEKFTLENIVQNKYAEAAEVTMDRDSLQEEDELEQKPHTSSTNLPSRLMTASTEAREALSDDDQEVTVFESIFKNKKGEDERIVRRVKMRQSDPVHSTVRFAGTENEQQFMGIVEEGKTDVKVMDAEGNVTNINITKI